MTLACLENIKSQPWVSYIQNENALNDFKKNAKKLEIVNIIEERRTKYIKQKRKKERAQVNKMK